MSNGKILRYTDPRRFGAWLWTKELEGHNVLAHLGPEPLSDEFNGEYLQQKCAKKKTAIKPWLMDNKLVVGVGNIYASGEPCRVCGTPIVATKHAQRATFYCRHCQK